MTRRKNFIPCSRFRFIINNRKEVFLAAGTFHILTFLHITYTVLSFIIIITSPRWTIEEINVSKNELTEPGIPFGKQSPFSHNLSMNVDETENHQMARFITNTN